MKSLTSKNEAYDSKNKQQNSMVDSVSSETNTPGETGKTKNKKKRNNNARSTQDYKPVHWPCASI